jgi:hypothetical protein
MIHVVNESKSPAFEMTTTMWCGATCIQLFYGAITPNLTFVGEAVFLRSASRRDVCTDCALAFETERRRHGRSS